ncbi:SDR family NAD(P)-dependent oxidoreductase [Amycolatopsis sp. NPDC005232]|uniref:SDR family NAD(P)-dependent oxidoreductase n=1 Tax=Amycolatopsis sp. NPDC005232 TaxID=3157027 RepID=UPI0033A51FBB
MSKVWFITGTSRGFGRVFAESALARGDQVVATARDLNALDDLGRAHGSAVLPLALDVTDKAAVGEAVDKAVATFGRLDVVVNNAGYGLYGTVEELNEVDLRAQIETNVFGSLWVDQAVLPHLRRQGSGHIIQISSLNGIAAFVMMGGYSASKWASEALSDSLAQEVSGFGIKVTIVEPALYATDFAGPSAAHSAPMAAYDGVRKAFLNAIGDVKAGDPAAVGPALLKIVDTENPPLRVVFGEYALNGAQAAYADRLATWKEWADLALEAEGRSS